MVESRFKHKSFDLKSVLHSVPLIIQIPVNILRQLNFSDLPCLPKYQSFSVHLTLIVLHLFFLFCLW